MPRPPPPHPENSNNRRRTPPSPKNFLDLRLRILLELKKTNAKNLLSVRYCSVYTFSRDSYFLLCEYFDCV